MKATACSISELSDAAVDALRGADVQPDRVVLRCGTLPKSVYSEVNQALTRLGGRWDGRAEAHLFDLPVGGLLTAILDGAAEFPAANPTAFFPTPATLASTVVAQSLTLSTLPQNAEGLEPEAGRAALIRAVRAVRPDIVFSACEIDAGHRSALSAEGVELIGDDFLDLPEFKQFDFIIANPPFALEGDKFAWVTHLEKMLRLLKPGGLLIVIVPVQITFVQNKRVTALRDLLTRGGRIVENDPKAFAESGTGAKTVTVYYGPGERTTSQHAGPSVEPTRLPSVGECLANVQTSLEDAIRIAEGMERNEPAAAPEADSTPITAENVYWRDVRGRVIDKGHLYVDERGAVIYWTGNESGEAQSHLRRRAAEKAPEAPRATKVHRCAA